MKFVVIIAFSCLDKYRKNVLICQLQFQHSVGYFIFPKTASFCFTIFGV